MINKLTHLYIILMLVGLNSLFAQSSFELHISTPLSERVTGIIQDDEGNYVAVGYKYDNLTEILNAYLLKINNSGSVLEERVYNLPDSNTFFSEIKYINSTYYILGSKGAIIDGIHNILCIKILDKDLNILDDVSYDLRPYDIIDSRVIVNTDSNVVACETLDINGVGTDFAILEFNASGDSLRSKIFVLDDYQFAQSILELKNHLGYNIIAYASVNDFPYLHIIIKIDSLLNIKEIDSIPLGYREQNSCKWLNDSLYLLTGKKSVYDPLTHVMAGVMLLDSSQNVYRENHFGMGGDTINYPAMKDNVDFIFPDNIYYGGIANIKPSQMPWQHDPSWIMLNNMNSNLELNWQRFYGGDAFYYLWSLKATQDGGCVLLATRYDYTVQDHEYDIVILKVDTNGLITSIGESPAIPVEDVILFPNPGSDHIDITGADPPASIFLYDAKGKLILSEAITSISSRINTTALSSGTYFYQVLQGSQVVKSGKWIKR